MTELERLLMDGLKRLSDQYATDMRRLEEQNSLLLQQVRALAARVENLADLMKKLEP